MLIFNEMTALLSFFTLLDGSFQNGKNNTDNPKMTNGTDELTQLEKL